MAIPRSAFNPWRGPEKRKTAKCRSCVKRQGVTRVIHGHPGQPILCENCFKLRIERVRLNRLKDGNMGQGLFKNHAVKPKELIEVEV